MIVVDVIVVDVIVVNVIVVNVSLRCELEQFRTIVCCFFCTG